MRCGPGGISSGRNSNEDVAGDASETFARWLRYRQSHAYTAFEQHACSVELRSAYRFAVIIAIP